MEMRMTRMPEENGSRQWKAAITVVLGLMWLGLTPAISAAQNVPPPPAGARPGAPAVGPTFRPVRLMARQTEGEGFRKLAGVSVDRETGEVLVADSGNNLVTILSRAGVPLLTFGYNGEVAQPSQAVTDGQGRILVLAGVPRRVKLFSYRGEPRGDFSFPGFAGAATALPTALTVDRAGHLYIAEGTSGRILVYSPEGRLRLTVGGRGEGPGTFTSVTALAVDAAGTLYVADAQHKPSIQLFDRQGRYLRGWGEHSSGVQNFSLPAGIGVDPLGRVLVADTLRQSVSVFTAEGRYLFRFGGLGVGLGALAYPSGLGVDPAGRLYVAEAVNARVQVFEPVPDRTGGRMPGPLPAETRQAMTDGLGQMLQRRP